MDLDRRTVEARLRLEDEASLAALWREADRVRRDTVGDAVHLRGIVEISNHCVRRCGYCGINAANPGIERYRMSRDEVMDCVAAIVRFGYGTVVLQAGEDPGLTAGWVADLVRAIKAETGLAVTLSLGERGRDELALWRRAGADRYLLKFETGRSDLYDHIHPPLAGGWSDRFALLAQLGELGYEVGSGLMIGVPGQTWTDLADDILRFRALDLDMIGVGPFLPHPGTPLAAEHAAGGAGADQVPNSELMTYKVLALTRLVCPRANIPTTTALATVNDEAGRELGLQRGANVIMPTVTPARYRRLYDIYPSRASTTDLDEGSESVSVRERILGLGRTVGTGRGDALRPRTGDGPAAAGRE